MRKALCIVPTCVFAIVLAVGPLAGAGGGRGGICFQDGTPSREVGVLVMDSCFSPETISIEAGQTVTWELFGEAQLPHTVTFADGNSSEDLVDTFAVKFREPGVYAYSCAYHPGMVGAVTVSGAAVPGLPTEVVETALVDDLATDEVALAGAGNDEVVLTGNDGVVLSIDPLTALFLVGIAFAFGAGAAGAARVIRDA